MSLLYTFKIYNVFRLSFSTLSCTQTHEQAHVTECITLAKFAARTG